MADPSDEEKKCIRILAKLLEEGKGDEITEDILKHEGMDFKKQSFEVMMKMMHHHCAIDWFHPPEQPKKIWATPYAVELTRGFDVLEKKSKEREDIVEKVTESARKHPVTAYAIIGLFILTALVTLINQAIQLIKNIGSIGQ